MDQSSHLTDSFPIDCDRARRLTLVPSRLRLAEPCAAVPEQWQAGLNQLLDWLAVEVDYVPAAKSRLPRVPGWARAVGASSQPATVFAPWIGWSPAAFQHGGHPGLPAAQFVASYLIEHARGCAPGRGGIDIMLMSPHPATCIAQEAGSAPLPHAAAMQAMLRAARAEGRERVAIILHAHQRNALARQLLAGGKKQTCAGIEMDIITIEDALVPLMAGRARWDAIIAMPDVRSIVFTVLAETSGVRGPWPMLWFAQGRLQLVTSETPGDGMRRLSLDAPALIHALALTLHAAGKAGAALNLHESWARVRGRGVTTAARGSDAPYASEVTDAEFIALHQREIAAGGQPAGSWRALKNTPVIISVREMPPLRVISTTIATEPAKGGLDAKPQDRRE